jgi:hypothetical protein
MGLVKAFYQRELEEQQADIEACEYDYYVQQMQDEQHLAETGLAPFVITASDAAYFDALYRQQRSDESNNFTDAPF